MLIAALGGAPASGAPLRPDEDTLTIGIVAPVGSLHPNARTLSEHFLISLGHRPLAAPDVHWSTL